MDADSPKSRCQQLRCVLWCHSLVHRCRGHMPVSLCGRRGKGCQRAPPLFVLGIFRVSVSSPGWPGTRQKSSCLSLPSAEITDGHHHTWLGGGRLSGKVANSALDPSPFMPYSPANPPSYHTVHWELGFNVRVLRTRVFQS